MFTVGKGNGDNFDVPDRLNWELNFSSNAKMVTKSKGQVYQLVEGHTEKAEHENGISFNESVIPHTIIYFDKGIPNLICLFDVQENYNQITEARNSNDNNREIEIIPVITYQLLDKKLWKQFKNSSESEPILAKVKEIEANGKLMTDVKPVDNSIIGKLKNIFNYDRGPAMTASKPVNNQITHYKY